MPFVGEAIAIATVLCWTVSVQFFGAASKEVGASPVNIIRLSIALILFGIFLFLEMALSFQSTFRPMPDSISAYPASSVFGSSEIPVPEDKRRG